jgi:hypothetical protein
VREKVGISVSLRGLATVERALLLARGGSLPAFFDE